MRLSLAFACFLFIVTLFQFTAFSFSSEQPAVLCHSDERLALLQLKDSFIIDKQALAAEISKLYRLSSLDFSNNWDTNPSQRLLVLEKPDVKSLIQNLTNLKYLNLSYVVMASPIPSVLANLSSLTSLYLESCGLQGMFPLAIFRLPNLETIWLSHNLDLTGYLLEFNFSNKLKKLALWNTSFSGELPASIENLSSLEFLGLGHCNFSGHNYE
ncbi:hypothetical protein GOBAR_AA26792 [Gossypium barbadense]|uniref:Leucine-rich repeat-containing N-terminal plant-type domain-containing protein n=1 Tax=Gossypium barbadense TaxID=3634 RepID=A0A2P5WS04_GOSBA|nr:hypothetical protein GOBAR_AA26792 [Gossypium barbadense]